jgi:hypothetical protein
MGYYICKCGHEIESTGYGIEFRSCELCKRVGCWIEEEEEE